MAMAAVVAGTGANREVPLYGGAITTHLPQTFLDASTLREIPDNQEVWLDKDTEQSVIIEILEYESKADEADPLPFFFNDLVEHDGSTLVETWATAVLAPSQGVPASSLCYQGGGIQRASKFNETATHEVHVHLGLIRLKEVESDILVTYNEPLGNAAGGGRGRDVVAKIMETMSIKEMSLFAPGPA
mmetsp:Transcript_40916/g.73955  ORF Transcript_40916/g.73955 Transcript_40916/m.73955 type:complete len:187 (-) Transcript_40916:195-755(-)